MRSNTIIIQHNTRFFLHPFNAVVTFCSVLSGTDEGGAPLTSVCSPGLLLSLCEGHRSQGRSRSWLRQARPDLPQTGAGGQGPARGQWWDGITRLNNVRIMGLKPRLSMGSLGSHNCQTTGISAFSNPRSLAGPRPPSRWHLGILLHDKIEIGVDTPSSWNATNASPWISN